MRKLSFLICLTISSLSYSQTIFPKQTVLDGDTVVVISREQVKLINYTFLTLEEYKAMTNSYQRQIQLQQQQLLRLEDLNINLRTQVDRYDAIIQEQDELVEELNAQLTNVNRKLKMAKVTRIVYTCVGVVGGAYIGYTAHNFVSLIR